MATLLCFLFPSTGRAVVGQAEQYDEFKQEDLEEFQKGLTKEEQEHQLKLLEMQKGIKKAQGEKDENLDQLLKNMQEQLLQIPKRNRFRIETNGKYQYDSNMVRAVPRKEKDDSLFDTDSTLLFDLSGKKTDLRWDVYGGKHWDVEFPEQDFWTGEERIRYRRRYFRKLQHSFQSRLARTSNKTIELNVNKIRWDSDQQTSYNLPLTRKLSLNMDLDSKIRYFQDPFDRDSNWQATAAPSAFWNFTPKSRIALGYQFGISHIRSKSGDSNTHEVHAGYFGKITRKSSVSLDTSFSYQIPKSRDTATVKTWNLGVGYMWQMTGKTQITWQAIRSQQYSSSDISSGSVGAENVTVTKTDSYYVNDSLSMSLNSRLTRQLTAGLNLNFSHSYNRVLKNGDKDTEVTQFTFPFGLTLTYFIKRWATLNLGYTFTYRTGYEKLDRYRDHLLSAALRLLFL